MKILLIKPAPSKYTIGLKRIMRVEPLELEYLSSVLKNYQVKILDMNFDKNLSSILCRYKPDIVGITAYITDVPVVLKILKEVKREDYSIVTVVGGHHATVCPDDFKNSFVDVILQGENLFAMKRIAEELSKGKQVSPMDGVLICNKKGVWPKNNKSATLYDINSYPMPDRRILEKHRPYYYGFGQAGPIAIIKTSWGCNNRCSFCSCWVAHNGYYQERDVKKIVQELEDIQEERVWIVDDNFLVNSDRIDAIYNEIVLKGTKKKYCIYGRADFIVNHPDVIEKWASIGLKCVHIGAESFFDKDLKEYNKKSNVSVTFQAIKILERLEITPTLGLMFRNDYKTDDFLEFSRRIKNTAIPYAEFTVLTPLPNTPYYNKVKSKLKSFDYRIYDFLHPVLPTKIPIPIFMLNIILCQLTLLFSFKRRCRKLGYKNSGFGILPYVKNWKLLKNGILLLVDLLLASFHPDLRKQWLDFRFNTKKKKIDCSKENHLCQSKHK